MGLFHLSAELSYLLALLSGFLLGYLFRHFTKRRAIIVPPPTGTRGAYEVRHNGRVLYTGFDLQEAKRVYKDDHPMGILELYSHGNHTASRKI